MLSLQRAETFSQLVPKEYHFALALLGRFDWVHIEPQYYKGEPRTITRLNDSVIDHCLSICHHDSIRQLKAIISNSKLGSSVCLHYYVMSKVFADGPKVFRPTQKQCEALSQITVDIPWEDYSQPFTKGYDIVQQKGQYYYLARPAKEIRWF